MTRRTVNPAIGPASVREPLSFPSKTAAAALI